MHHSMRFKHYGDPLTESRCQERPSDVSACGAGSEFHHRIFRLWQKAKTPVDERIEMFVAALTPSISNPLAGVIWSLRRI